MTRSIKRDFWTPQERFDITGQRPPGCYATYAGYLLGEGKNGTPSLKSREWQKARAKLLRLRRDKPKEFDLYRAFFEEGRSQEIDDNITGYSLGEGIK